MDSINRHPYALRRFEKDVRVLYAWALKQDGLENICGIPRGGLIPAVFLSNYLDLPMVGMNEIGPNTLVVDDIVDTGETIKNLMDSLDFKPRIISLYSHPKAIIQPDYSVRDKPGEEPGGKTDWVIFPWEKPRDSMRDSDK